jgi:hypothetical protein
MKKFLIFGILILAITFSNFGFSQTTTSLEEIQKDITILRIINVFGLSKEQINKAIPIFQKGIERREKNLNEIRDALLSGKKYGELTKTYVNKLEKTNSRILSEFMEILNPQQKEKAQRLFNLISDSEMQTLMESGPKMIEMIMGRLEILKDMGIFAMPEGEEGSSMMMTIAQMGLQILGSIQAKVQEKFASLLASPRCIVLLQEQLKKIPDVPAQTQPEKKVK